MRNLIGLIVGLGIALSSASCSTTLSVKHLDADSKPPLKGVYYFLPFTQFELTVSRTLTSCPMMKGQPFKYKTQVTVVSYVSQPDPTEEYGIDLTTLSNWWKTSDLKITFFPGGLLQSFNATSSDQSAQIYQNVLSGVGQIAATIATDRFSTATAPAAAARPAARRKGKRAPPPLPITPYCNPATNAALSPAAKAANTALQVATDQLNKDSAVLKALLTASSSMGTKLDANTQKHVLQAVDLVNREIAAQSLAQKPVSDYQKALTVSTTFRWPVNGTLNATTGNGKDDGRKADAQQVALPGVKEALEKWAAGTVPETAITERPFEVSISLQRLPGSELVPPTNDNTKSSGIRFRVPARGQLILCLSKATPDSTKMPVGKDYKTTVPPCAEASPADTLPATADAIWEGSVPQLGRIDFLPYRNRPFQSNVLTATFNADGTLSNAEYSEPTSSGAAASSAFSAAATSATSTANAIANASTTRLNAQLANVQARNNLTAAEATASNAAQSNELTQIQAQSNLIAAQDAQAVASQVQQATANTTLLNALAAQDTAQTALKSAQTALQP